MKSHTKIIASSLLLILGAVSTSNASALTYQQDIGVSFTFNPSISVTLSSADLIIPNLAPGTASDSNIITVNVKTNNANGYTLNATVGNNTTFNTRDLKHQTSTVTDKFSSVNFGTIVAANTALTDNTWGYSYSLDSGTSWIANATSGTSAGYSGLPLYSDTTNVATIKTSTGPVATSAGDDVQFKIAARAADTIAAGEYNNVINFTAVATPVPVTLEMAYADAGKEKLNGYYKLQDMNASICNAAEVLDEGGQMQAIDVRDNKVYWITKLQDGHCWMTQNLDLDLDSTVTYTHANTDLGWGTDTATVSWTPTRSTIDATGGTISGWTNDYNTPYSVDTGDYYYAGYDGETLLPSTTVNYLTTTNTDYFDTNPYSVNGTHGHVGNYYNWSAAVASNDTSSYTDSTLSNPANNPQNSICPAGWRLPVITSYSTTLVGTNEFANLNYYYNNKVTNTSSGLEASPLFFARGGLVYSGSLGFSGYRGDYWSSSVNSSSYAFNLYFSASLVSPQSSSYRYYGRSVRCLAR